jgi:hypothetical protein
MGKIAKRFLYNGRFFLFDCAYCDEKIQDGTFAFGAIRELCIRDCYFKHQPDHVLASARKVIDLGANRGLFSVMMAARADLVVSVEANSDFAPVIDHNMEINGFSNYETLTAFIGEGGKLDGSPAAHFSIRDLIDRYHLNTIDFLKIDIEGSEFGLFAAPDWLQHVQALSMEVHPQFGNPQGLITALQAHHFSYAMADNNLRKCSNPKQMALLYAWKPSPAPERNR